MVGFATLSCGMDGSRGDDSRGDGSQGEDGPRNSDDWRDGGMMVTAALAFCNFCAGHDGSGVGSCGQRDGECPQS